MAYTEQMTQRLGILDYLNTQSVNNTNVQSHGIDMSKCRRAFYIVRFDTAASGQANFQLQSSAQANFNVAHNMTGTLSANFNTNNQLATIEVRSDQVTQQNHSDRYVRLYIATNANIQLSAVGLGGDGVQKPLSQANINTTLLGGQVVCTT